MEEKLYWVLVKIDGEWTVSQSPSRLYSASGRSQCWRALGYVSCITSDPERMGRVLCNDSRAFAQSLAEEFIPLKDYVRHI